MVPEISEFSYGFALTNELVGWGGLSSAPIFPSLIEEGKAGGGYDVYLDRPGFPLYLQFKRADCMLRRSAKQVSAIAGIGHHISVPFYRFGIMEPWRSDQHEMLLELDDGINFVFYAAPRFHTMSEINSAWTSGRVAEFSIFIRPQSIGALTDNISHHVAYDDRRAYFCSEAKVLQALTAADLIEKFRSRLKQDDRPFRAVLPEVLADAERVRREVRSRSEEVQEVGLQIPTVREIRPLERAPAPRPHIKLEDERGALRELADIASRDFNAQLVIVQPSQ